MQMDKNVDYRYFIKYPWEVMKIDHWLDHKELFNKFLNIEFIYYILSRHNWESQKLKTKIKPPTVCKFKYIFAYIDKV